MSDFLSREFLGDSLFQWLTALTITAALLAVIGLVKVVLERRFGHLAERSPAFFDDAALALAERTSLALLALPIFYLAALGLGLAAAAHPWARPAAVILLLVQVALWGGALIRCWARRFRDRNIEQNAGAVGTAGVLSFVASLIFYSVLLLLALDNIPGVEITALVASLGIGGVAVALAVQSILSDLFASLSIALDKPFVLGDFITVDDLSGTVEQIGLKTTRLRSLSGEQLIFSNADLLGSRIRNFQRLEERRLAFTVSVAYDTPPEQLRRLPDLIRGFVESHEQTRFDRAHLQRFGDFGLVFEVVYFVCTPDYGHYVAVQQAVNLAILEHCAAAGIAFGYPAQQDSGVNPVKIRGDGAEQ